MTQHPTPLHELNAFLVSSRALADRDVGRYMEGMEFTVPTLAHMLKDADEYLTGKPGRYVKAYESDAERILTGETVELHLSDGGYSRLMATIGVDQDSKTPVHMWLDRGLSTPGVVERWEALVGDSPHWQPREYKYIVEGARGAVYGCDTLAEARKMAGKTGRIVKIKRNPEVFS